jgi:hypothetical protein
MAQAGYTPIKLYHSTSAGNTPSAGNLANGELALNIADSVMSIWFKNASGVAKRVFANPAGLVYPTADGTNNQFLKTDGAGNLTFATISSVATATNLAGGATGSVPYQSGAGATTFLGIGTAAQVLQVNSGATAPEWVSSTGTGNVVRATSPTLTSPTLGAATATSINKVAITSPASSATLTIANGKTLVASNSLTLAGTDSTTMTFPPASASIGYLNVPLNQQTSDYTALLADSGKALVLTSGSGVTFTIPSNGSVAYDTGTVLTFVNMSANNLSIAITSDTMYLSGSGSTGTRTLAQYGVATAIKLTSTSWLISGSNLT